MTLRKENSSSKVGHRHSSNPSSLPRIISIQPQQKNELDAASVLTPVPTITEESQECAAECSNLLQDLQQCITLYKDERHLVAYELYEKVQQQGSTLNLKERQEIAEFIISHSSELSRLQTIAPKFQQAKSIIHLQNSSWIYSHSNFGISTYYRHESHDNSLSIKLEGELKDAPIFEQMAVIRESDLFSEWAPFVSNSKRIAQLGRVDFVAWFMISILGIFVRDGVFRAIGCDAMKEEGCIILVAEDFKESLSEKDLQKLQIPQEPRAVNASRMNINLFQAVVDILSPTSARTTLVANVQLNLNFLSTTILEFFLKRMCGVLLSKLQHAAYNIVKHPKTSPHAKRIREDTAFYQEWLLPKFLSYCQDLGWTMPPVKALEVSLADDTTSNEIFEDELSHSTPNSSINASLTKFHENLKTFLKENEIKHLIEEHKLKKEQDKQKQIKLRRASLERKLKPKAFSDSTRMRLEKLHKTKQRLKLKEQKQNELHFHFLQENSHYEARNNLFLFGLLFFQFLTQALSNFSLFCYQHTTSFPSIHVNFIMSNFNILFLLIFYIMLYSIIMYSALLQLFDILEHALLISSSNTNGNIDLLQDTRSYVAVTLKKQAFTFGFYYLSIIIFFSIVKVSWYDYYDSQPSCWRSISLEYTKLFMSYTSTFLLVIVTFLHFTFYRKHKKNNKSIEFNNTVASTSSTTPVFSNHEDSSTTLLEFSQYSSIESISQHNHQTNTSSNNYDTVNHDDQDTNKMSFLNDEITMESSKSRGKEYNLDKTLKAGNKKIQQNSQQQQEEHCSTPSSKRIPNTNKSSSASFKKIGKGIVPKQQKSIYSNVNQMMRNSFSHAMGKVSKKISSPKKEKQSPTQKEKKKHYQNLKKPFINFRSRNQNKKKILRASASASKHHNSYNDDGFEEENEDNFTF